MEISSQETIINEKNDAKKIIQDELSITRVKKNNLVNKINSLIKETYEYKTQKEVLENNLLNDSKLPHSVKNILNNTRLSGVHNVIGKLIEVDKKYATAIDVALGYSANFLVVDDEETAKKCILYLKDNNLGRATFFPLNVIKSKYVEPKLVERLEQVDGFVGVASKLINFESKYTSIVENQLGNVLIVKDINSLNLIGRICEHKYRIVSLDGEIEHAGGSITGGTIKNSNSVIKDRFMLDELNIKIDNLNSSKQKLEIELKEYDSNINILENKEVEVEKTVTLNVGWTADMQTAITSSLTKYVPFDINGTRGLIVQTLVETEILNANNLPIKTSTLEVGVPEIKGTKPSKVVVTAKSTEGTNGKKDELVLFGENNWKYDSDSKVTTITVDNKVLEDGTYYSNGGTDKYLITYTYPAETLDVIGEENVAVISKVVSKIERYSNNGTKTSELERTEGFELARLGEIVSYSIEREDDLNKGLIYANYNNVKTNNKYSLQRYYK